MRFFKSLYVSGTVLEPYGIVRVEHQKDKQGRIITELDVPRQIKVIEHAELSNQTIGFLG